MEVVPLKVQYINKLCWCLNTWNLYFLLLLWLLLLWLSWLKCAAFFSQSRVWVLQTPAPAVRLNPSRLRRSELSSSVVAGSAGAGWWLWCWRVAYGVWEHGAAAGGPEGSCLLWLESPSVSAAASWWGWSHRLWAVAPCPRGSGAWMGCNLRPKRQLCIHQGSADASSPHQQL